MKKFLFILFALLLIPTLGISYGQTTQVFTNAQVYTEGQPLFVYGTSTPDENLIIRLIAPDGTFAKFDQVITNPEGGGFNHELLIWPKATDSFPHGTYVVEVISSDEPHLSTKIDIKFTSSDKLVEIPIERHINTLVFVPETSAINTPIRVFVQTTSDGLLIAGSPEKLLETTHVHLPDGTVQTLSDSFSTLHQGLYFVDYTPDQLGTYVFHVVTFHQGTVSHGSAATTVMSQDISGISDQILRLNKILDETSDELNQLKNEISGFDSTLEGASGKIESSVSSMSTSVTNIEEASGQLNSLLFPIVALIGIIVALQIVVLARRR